MERTAQRRSRQDADSAVADGRTAGRLSLHSSSSLPAVWPLVMLASASEAAASALDVFARHLIGGADGRRVPEPGWQTPHRVMLDLPTMSVRDFSATPSGPATLICTPFALHGSSVADFAPGHSLVETLLGCGIGRLAATDWRSATPDMRFFSIDTYLADLNVVVDDLGPPVDLIGLCQGAWMALVYAARFPAKVRRLVLAAGPVDVAAAASSLSELAAGLPLQRFEELVRFGDGRVPGERALDLWGGAIDPADVGAVLQLPGTVAGARRRDLEGRFRDWYAWTVDLPGTYYLQTVRWLFKENRIAAGRFVALGRRIDLASLRTPMFLLAARDDDIVAPDQLLATARLVGTPAAAIATAVEPCGHLSLFMGARTLRRAWPRIGRWLAAAT